MLPTGARRVVRGEVASGRPACPRRPWPPASRPLLSHVFSSKKWPWTCPSSDQRPLQMVTGGPAPLHSGCPAAPCRPGPCPVTGAWTRVSLGASQGQAACAEGSRCLISCDCPSSHVTGRRVAVLQSRTQTPGRGPPAVAGQGM